MSLDDRVLRTNAAPNLTVAQMLIYTDERRERVYEATDFLFAALTGFAVIGVTLLGDRLGGRLGGLVATAPVTTSAAHVVLASSVAPALAAAQVIQGVQALLAVTFGVPAFFYAVKFTKGMPSRSRLTWGLGAFLAVFVPMTFLFASFPINVLSGFVLLFALHALLAFNFMREVVPAQTVPKPLGNGRSPRELIARFASGAVVVLAIRALIDVAPALAGALAVVPAVFIVSLTVLGLRHDATFAARASQAGLFGATAVAVFVLVIAGLLALGVPGGIWTALPFGWVGYLGSLALLARLHGRIQRSVAAAPPSSPTVTAEAGS